MELGSIEPTQKDFQAELENGGFRWPALLFRRARGLHVEVGSR